jgi:hypothetical protein
MSSSAEYTALLGLVGAALAGAGPVKVLGVESTASAAAGVRTGRGLTTYYVRTRLDALDVTLVGAGREFEGPSTGDDIVELTRDAAGPREIAFRSVDRGRPGQVVETVARLDLRDPGNRVAAARLLSLRLPWPGDVRRELRTVMARAVRQGIVERAVYDERDDSAGLELGAKLGIALGVDAGEVDVDRTLVAASAWTEGSRERERADCGVAAAGA